MAVHLFVRVCVKTPLGPNYLPYSATAVPATMSRLQDDRNQQVTEYERAPLVLV